MRCVISLNNLEVPARPMLQKCSHKCATETEHEAEEPDGVDKYCQSGRRERTLGKGPVTEIEWLVLESCWDICVRSDWVMTLGSWYK